MIFHTFAGFYKKSVGEMELSLEINADKLPKHIAIIMDGNGRWAKSHGKNRALGHRAGVKTVREITDTSPSILSPPKTGTDPSWKSIS